MPRDGSSGAYSRASSAYVANTIISETAVNAEMDDLATAMTASVAKDGQTTMTANLKMGGYKLTGMTAGSASTDSARYDQTVTSTLTTRGDIVQRGASDPERLAIGAAGKILTSDGTDVVWGDGPLTTQGDLIVQGATDLDRLAVGASGAVLGSDGTDPAWVTNVAKTDANNNFTEGQTITKAAANVDLVLTRTGAGAAGAFMGAHSSSADFGSNTLVQVNWVMNGVTKLSMGTGAGFFTPGNSDQGAGTFDTAGYYKGGTALPFQEGIYESAEIAITPGTGSSLSHGLGVNPVAVFAHLVCKVIDHGFAVGNEVRIPLGGASNGTTASGIGVWTSSSVVSYRISSGTIATIIHATTGASVFPTTASWRLVLTAVA